MGRSPRKHPDAAKVKSAWRHFLRAGKEGRVEIHPRVYARLDEMGMRLGEVGSAVQDAIEEIRLANVSPVADPWDPPGHAFVWESKRFGRRMYLKFRLEGKRPTVVLYSIHPSDY